MTAFGGWMVWVMRGSGGWNGSSFRGGLMVSGSFGFAQDDGLVGGLEENRQRLGLGAPLSGYIPPFAVRLQRMGHPGVWGYWGRALWSTGVAIGGGRWLQR